MMKRALVFVTTMLFAAVTFAAQPPITGTPTIDKPKNLLTWPRDTTPALPDLTETTANVLNDLHAKIDCSNFDLVLSTAGNYHMALHDLWYDVLLPQNTDVISTWYYTTSPPLALQQTTNANLTVGNLALKCIPGVVVARAPELQQLVNAGLTTGPMVPVVKNRGVALVVKKGNPKNVQTIWDLRRGNVSVATASPVVEPGALASYAAAVYNIALNNRQGAPGDMTPEELFNIVFNSGVEGKWVVGERIHHRELPWSVAYGRADVGVVAYHLAKYFVDTYPDLYEMIVLPELGNASGTLSAIRIKNDNLTARQLDARERLMTAFRSPEFAQILLNRGLIQP